MCDTNGDLAGGLGPFDVVTPWWQDVEPIQRSLGSLAVLRLLGGSPRPRVPGASVRYLARLTSERADLHLSPICWQPPERDHELRMPWARPGGPVADLAWAARVAAPSGPPVQHRTWNLSAIWSYPTAQGRVWLKCVPPFFVHEAKVLGLLQGALTFWCTRTPTSATRGLAAPRYGRLG